MLLSSMLLHASPFKTASFYNSKSHAPCVCSSCSVHSIASLLLASLLHRESRLPPPLSLANRNLLPSLPCQRSIPSSLTHCLPRFQVRLRKKATEKLLPRESCLPPPSSLENRNPLPSLPCQRSIPSSLTHCLPRFQVRLRKKAAEKLNLKSNPDSKFGYLSLLIDSKIDFPKCSSKQVSHDADGASIGGDGACPFTLLVILVDEMGLCRSR